MTHIHNPQLHNKPRRRTWFKLRRFGEYETTTDAAMRVTQRRGFRAGDRIVFKSHDGTFIEAFGTADCGRMFSGFGVYRVGRSMLPKLARRALRVSAVLAYSRRRA